MCPWMPETLTPLELELQQGGELLIGLLKTEHRSSYLHHLSRPLLYLLRQGVSLNLELTHLTQGTLLPGPGITPMCYSAGLFI